MSSSINKWVAANALGFSIMFAGMKNFTADYIIQTKFNNNKCKQIKDNEDDNDSTQINYRRLLVFTSFGLLYVGGAQYVIFNRMLPRYLPGLLEGKIKPAAKAVIFDQLIHMPFLYLPVFYFIRELGNFTTTNDSHNKHPEEFFYNQIIQPAYTSWKNGFSSDMLVEMSIFVPVQALNFTIIKPHFRVPFLTCFGFLWVMTLSYRRGMIMHQLEEDEDRL